MSEIRDEIAKTIYESDTSLRCRPHAYGPSQKKDNPFEEIRGQILWQYQRNAEHIIKDHILPLLDRISGAVELIESGSTTIAAHNLDAILEDFGYGELREEKTIQ